MEDVTNVPVPELSDAAVREWSRYVEGIMRGLAHALNNRAAALSALLEFAREPDDDPAATQAILATELERVRELTEIVRLLDSPRGTVEAVAPGDAVPVVLAAARLHAELRERTITFDADAAPPVRVARWMLQRALIALAASSTDAGDRSLHVTLAGDGDWLIARADVAQAAKTSAYVTEVARAMGGEALAGGFRLPTLEALRRREGR